MRYIGRLEPPVRRACERHARATQTIDPIHGGRRNFGRQSIERQTNAMRPTHSPHVSDRSGHPCPRRPSSAGAAPSVPPSSLLAMN